MLKNEWKLKYENEMIPIVPEVPLTLTTWFLKGDYNDFEQLNRAFHVKFHINNRTISFFNLLLTFTNQNLERSKEGKSRQYGYRYTSVDEKTLWRFIRAYMVRQLQLNGKAERVSGKELTSMIHSWVSVGFRYL